MSVPPFRVFRVFRSAMYAEHPVPRSARSAGRRGVWGDFLFPHTHNTFYNSRSQKRGHMCKYPRFTHT